MKFAVIGGGISGLAVAHGLAARGQEVVVLESGARVGGAIQSFHRDGFITEAGPNSFLDNEPATGTLISALGLSSKVRPAELSMKRRFVFTGGALRLLPSSPPAFLSSDILPFGARMRVLGELFTRRAEQGSDESLASFGRRHLGPVATDKLVDAFQTGIYAGDPERLSVLAAFPRLTAMELEHRSLGLALIREARERKANPRFSADAPKGPTTPCSIEGGLGTLVDALAAKLGAAVRTGVKVSAIGRTEAGWRVSLEGEALDADQLVLAAPSYAVAPLIRPLNEALAADLDAIEYAKIAVVHLGFRRGEGIPPIDGFGFLVPRSEGRKLLGCIYASSVFPWRAPAEHVLLTCLVGGARQGELIEQDDDALVRLVRDELAAMLGVSAAPVFQQLVRWRRGIPQYNVGHLARVERIEAAVRALPGLHLTGNAYRGVGLNDCTRNASQLAATLCAPPDQPVTRREIKISAR